MQQENWSDSDSDSNSGNDSDEWIDPIQRIQNQAQRRDFRRASITRDLLENDRWNRSYTAKESLPSQDPHRENRRSSAVCEQWEAERKREKERESTSMRMRKNIRRDSTNIQVQLMSLRSLGGGLKGRMVWV